ncbi:hypothetical protein TNIN_500371 [Trichonephila inaurata madagascariensis]|uniref:Uncharacterized protein n=1 Tax=Trichonephila inaurata madagascariensis TaxID=2747483 RepID=A0A8X6XIB0_9ARAC|nr:hypothetical protein TNIN_500371 [Trichonephila inaurata madagascariensis]
MPPPAAPGFRPGGMRRLASRRSDHADHRAQQAPQRRCRGDGGQRAGFSRGGESGGAFLEARSSCAVRVGRRARSPLAGLRPAWGWDSAHDFLAGQAARGQGNRPPSRAGGPRGAVFSATKRSKTGARGWSRQSVARSASLRLFDRQQVFPRV